MIKHGKLSNNHINNLHFRGCLLNAINLARMKNHKIPLEKNKNMQRQKQKATVTGTKCIDGKSWR